MEADFFDDNRTVEVENLSDTQCGYVLSSNGTTRRFMPHVRMAVPVRELRELSWQTGGLYLLQNYLRVYDKALAADFGISDDSYEHEYNWTSEDIDKCLNDPSIEVLMDALDFAPQGIIDSLEQRALDLELPDKRKLDAIGTKTGHDLEAMIANKHAYDEGETKENKSKVRRSTTKSPARRRVVE